MPAAVGKPTANPGRATPASSRIRSWAAAANAPVLPAEMATSASPLATSLQLTAMELSGLDRTASTGDSSIATVWLAWTTAYRFA